MQMISYYYVTITLVWEKFGLDYEIKFNGDKTQLMIVNYKCENEYQMKLNSKTLQRVWVIKYLGILIQDN